MWPTYAPYDGNGPHLASCSVATFMPKLQSQPGLGYCARNPLRRRVSRNERRSPAEVNVWQALVCPKSQAER